VAVIAPACFGVARPGLGLMDGLYLDAVLLVIGITLAYRTLEAPGQV
jgi:hypothetical protein